ncbi:MAG: ABC transporter substrate-binding protein [Anaerolineaceae bacterium]|nr:MAG: ABC transporter substrate-binding protein [Anaerolineaceae bacterium]
MKRRRLLTGLITLMIMGLILAGCKSLPYNTEIYGDLEDLDPSGQAITYWYQHSGDREEALQAMIRDFNATNEWGITVRGERAGSYGEIYNKVITVIPVGEVPEITVCYQNQAAMYVTQGAIIELTPYIESVKWGFTDEENEDFFPFVSLGDYLPEFDGRYGFPPHRSMEVLYYNEDWLRELGYNHPPRTWDEFKEMACAASDPEAGTYGYELSIDVSTFADMLYNRGGSMVNEDATAYTFGDQAGLEVLTFLKELFDEGCAIMETEGYGDQVDFGEGRVLFTISSSSGLPRYQEAVSDGEDFSWSISTMPTTLETPRVNIYGASLSILRTTPEKQLAAWLFIKWVTEAEQSARWSRASNYFPVRRSAADELADYFAENPQYEKAFGFLSHDMAIEPGVASYQECRGSIGEMLTAVVSGADPATWLADALDECNILMEEFSAD